MTAQPPQEPREPQQGPPREPQQEPPPESAEQSACWRVCDTDDDLSGHAVAINRHHLRIAEACAPQGEEVITDVTTRIAARLGISHSAALMYCDIGTMLAAYPKTGAMLESGAFSLAHLNTIAGDLVAVSPGLRAEVDPAVVRALRPTIADQAVPGPRTIHRRLQRLLAQYDPPARPTDSDELPPEPPKTQLEIDSRNADYTTFHLTLGKMDALELTRAIDSAAATQECSRAQALLALVRGEASADVTLNLYANAADLSSITGAGTRLEPAAAVRWLSRVTHLRFPGADSTKGYTPTPGIRAAVMGRDGTCRFPGCGVEAEDCQLDHIARYNHENSREGGATNTANLHCLCSTHHRVKTAGQWDVSMGADGCQRWTSVGDGHSVTTEPNGVLRRLTFAQRASRRTKVINERNTLLDAYRQHLRSASAAPNRQDTGEEPPF
ncbi:HNH endonuclease signature motif containing protein [Corynebacterium heidelbergense]|uniref:HNH endonuclease n=1 Tax=Corynebacterium heidelbergense TaxID=2055947 RepID=A0A364VAW5_9CORY|nr:HNH endonuclease signature motif containing protein [Corynebacterium heidelbergense]RAV33803.1 HNH endonuclease [Corynebacterium heidelbergense]WCZ36793.1 hypothetical protein CHEID_06280 [Corynebacterium heidelbergense]